MNWNPARLAVDRPIATLMVCIITALLGGVALSRIPIDLMPDIEFPTVTVTTLYPGAGPEEVETLITRPLEQTLSSVNGFERITSQSFEGSSSVRVEFNWGADLDVAVDEMRQAIDKIRNTLPDGIELPYLRRYDSNGSPIIYLGLSSPLPVTELTRLAELSIVPRLERLDGIARVTLRGHIRREIQVDIDRIQLDALGMGINEVVQSLQQANVSRPAGDFEDGHLNRLIRSRSEFKSLEEIRNLVVRRTPESAIRVRDIADVIDGHERITQRSRTNGEPGIMVYVFKQAGANTIDVSDQIQEAIGDLNRDLRNASLTIRMDKSDYIRASMKNMQQSAIVGMVLAMLVLVLFLRNFRSTLIIGVSMPLSLLATFIMIYLQGYTLNMISFGGLALGVGMLVDNSIVVLESIFRRREEGESARMAAINGTHEVSSAILASTITTLIVFLPLVFVSGMTALLLHQLAFVVCISMICSLIVSLTLTPTLAAYWLGPVHLESPRPMRASVANSAARSTWGSRAYRMGAFPARLMIRTSERVFQSIENTYAFLLRNVLRVPGVAFLVLLAAFSVTMGLLPWIGTEFLPKTDDGRMGITGTMEAGIKLETLDRQTHVIENTIAEVVPEAETMSTFIGDDADDGDGWNRCRAILQLVPRDEREATSEEVRKRIMAALPPIPGMKVEARVYSGLPMFRHFGNEGDNLAVLVRGHDRETAEQLANAVVAIMKDIPGLVNAEVQLDDDRPELVTHIDRAKASQLGISVQGISQGLETTFRGTEATVFREEGDEYNVLVRLREADRAGQADLDRIGVQTPTGQLVPLGNLVSYVSGQAPLSIDRLDRQRVISVSGAAEGRDLGSVVGELQKRLDALPIPAGFQVEIGGDWEDQQESFAMLTQGFALAILLMYMVMASQFESLLDPLLILFTLPLAAIGVVLVLVFWGTTLNVQSFIGLIVLAGVVVNNAIVLVDYAKQLRHSEFDLTPTEIVVRASVRRFRPIIMTTLTTVLGMLPVAFGWGEGGELQAPMARVVIGGLLSGTLITLWAIPLVLQACTPQAKKLPTVTPTRREVVPERVPVAVS